MRFLKLIAERALGSGYVRVQFAEAGVMTTGEYRCVVQRVGRRDSFLGANGWADASKFFMINIEEPSDSGESSFLLKPTVVQYMEASSNYEFTVLDAADSVLGTCNVFWKGVPGYRPPKDSPPVGIEIVSAPNLSGGAPVAEPVVERQTDPGPEVGWGSEAIADGESSGLDGNLGIDDSQTQSDENNPQHEGEGLQDVTPRPPKILMNCPLDASHQIFSDMMFCPICSKTLKIK
jgi:hypothetical protein